jgi:translation initiation factor IF-1
MKDEMLRTTATITEKIRAEWFGVRLDNGIEMRAIRAGRMMRRGYRINMEVGDRVEVEISPYDLKKCRIVWRLTLGGRRTSQL